MRADILGRAVRGVVAALVFTLGVVLCAPASIAQTPSPEDTLRAFHIAEKHIRDWSPPPPLKADAPDTKSDAPKAVGACITLKLRGEVIARGTAWSDSIAGPGAFSARVLAEAIRAAMRQAEPKLGIANDAMREQAIKLVTPDILISVELAGPLSAAEFATWDEAETSLRPGLDGVAVRIAPAGNEGGSPGPLHAIFPSQMMLSNMLPHRAMGAATAIALGEGGAAGALDDPKKLRTESGVRMYRFRVGQAVQPESGKAATALYRGQRLGLTEEVAKLDELRRFAGSLASHLILLSQSPESGIGEVGVAGNQESDAYASRTAMATVALAQYHRWRIMEKRPPERWLPEATQAIESLRDRSMAAAAKTNDPLVAALVSAGFSAYVRPFEKELPPEAAAVDWPRKIQGAFASNGQFVDRMSPTARAVIAFSLVPEWGEPDHIRWGFFTKAKTGVESARLGIESPSAVAMMPWFGWAEIRFERYERQVRTNWLELPADARREMDNYVKPKDIPSAIALRRMRDQCWSHQLSITDAGEDAIDMAGGIVFTSGLGDGKSGANPYPTWQCVRPLAFIATMLRDPRLTEPKERSREIVNLMQAMRFLRQLQVDEASAWMYPDPKLAIGGIRASTWDNSLPVDATSMTLLCVVEMIKSLDELAKPPAAPPSEKKE